MGKATGFLDYERAERPVTAPSERVQDFSEFRGGLPRVSRCEQGGRCMNCGVPFCQSDFGCPLHNLIPEWNEEVWNGNWSHALSRLLKTNNFPEFTGRVCPALCENACVCGLDGQPVTVHDNELDIIEYAYANGLMQPRIPAVRTDKQIAVIGSGPSGLAVADQLNQRGHNVTVFERDEQPGGLLMFGIPNMKLDKSVVRRRIDLMQREGIAFRTGVNVGTGVSGAELLQDFDAVVLCCGARRARDIDVKNRDAAGVYQAMEYLSAGTRAVLAETESSISAAGKDVIIVGNGDTATDCLATAIRQGAKSVVQLVRKPAPGKNTAVWPKKRRAHEPDYGHEEALAVYGCDPRLYSSVTRELLVDDNGTLTGAVVDTAGQEHTIPVQLLLIAAGFSGIEPSIAETFGLTPDAQGRIPSGKGDCTTQCEKIFIAGDARRGATLVATAIADGRACASKVDCFLEGYTVYNYPV